VPDPDPGLASATVNQVAPLVNLEGTAFLVSPCYALTNMEAETYPLRRERYDFMRWFQGTVVSSHERVAKPAMPSSA